MDRIFVYGTLKDGKGQCAYIHGDLFNLGPFPGIKNAGKSSNWVRGEVHDVTESRLKQLDGYEGVPWTYTRKSVSIFDENRDPLNMSVWVYEYVRDIPETARCGEEWVSSWLRT